MFEKEEFKMKYITVFGLFCAVIISTISICFGESDYKGNFRHRFYVTDQDNNRIHGFNDFEGSGWEFLGGPTPGDEIGQFNDPSGITLDSYGRIYIIDRNNGRIVRINNIRGAGWTTFGGSGTGVNQFNYPHDLAFAPDGKLYITDDFNNRLVRIDDMSGAGWVTYGSLGSGIGHFNHIRGLDIDSLGRIYIADCDNNRIVRLNDITGAGWTEYDCGGALNWPWGVTLGRNSDLIISNCYGNNIVKYNEISGVTEVLEGFSGPCDAAVDESSKIYVVDQNSHRLIRIDDISGAGWTTLGSFGSDLLEWRRPHYIEIDTTFYVGINEENISNKPSKFTLQTHPNPFNSTCVITAPTGAKVEIFDLNGKCVCSLRQAQGTTSDIGSDSNDRSVSLSNRPYNWSPDKNTPSGVYLVRATTADGQRVTKRVVLVR
jgi:DNA-binding beta-propeller fold protein YncE